MVTAWFLGVLYLLFGCSAIGWLVRVVVVVFDLLGAYVGLWFGGACVCFVWCDYVWLCCVNSVDI